MTLETDVQQGWHDAIVEMFDLDLEPITGDPNDKFYFTNQLKPDNSKIQWKGNTYEPLPIISSGYEKNTTGQIAQPSLTVANVMGTFTQVINSLDDLVGAKVTRRRTFAKYLDGEVQADPTQEFPIDIFFIERKTGENALTITWQLGSILDVEGLLLPRRVITQNYCQWKYRSSECGYTGAPVFGGSDALIPASASGMTASGIAVINANNLVVQRRQEAQIAINERNQAAANKEAACTSVVLLETQFNPPYEAGVNYYVYVENEPLGSYDNAFGGSISVTAVWNGVLVGLDQTYRQGPSQGPGYYAIERWGVSPSACSTATTTLNNAESALTTASNNLVAAQNNLNSLVAALPPSDPLWSLDVCGKRVNSCQVRFGSTWNSTNRAFQSQAVPFGGFPGAIQGRI